MDEKSRQLNINKVIDAPIDKVWEAWTDQKKIQEWWGPQGVTNPTCTWEAKEGGNIHIVMLAGKELGSMAGQEWPMSGQFKEVSKPNKLVFISSPLIDDKPVMDCICTVILEPEGDKTKLSLSIVVTNETSEAEGPIAGMEMGWNQSIDKLVEFIAEN